MIKTQRSPKSLVMIHTVQIQSSLDLSVAEGAVALEGPLQVGAQLGTGTQQGAFVDV